MVRLLVSILNPQPGESVYDPACGSAGMLVETINEVAADGTTGELFDRAHAYVRENY